jgi:hypothetical protein
MAWECLARRTPPLQLKETYHLINTGPGAALTMWADAMLAGFLAIGGRHRIIERSGDRAAVELTNAGQTVEFECTFADAKAAGLTAGKKGEKENWSSPRQRMQMLWARVISDGVRAMAPQVCAGKYTPEDFGVKIESDGTPTTDGAMIVDGEAVAYVVESPQPSAVAKQAAGKTPAGKEPAGTEAGQAAVDSATVVESDENECTAEQRKQIAAYFDALNLTAEQRYAVLRKRGVGAMRSLTPEQAAELLANLVKKISETMAGQSQEPKGVHEAPVAGPANQGQVDEIKRDLLPTLAQSDPGLYQKLVAKMKAAGLKFSDLSFADARSLIQQLRLKNLEAFFAASLTKYIEPAATPADPS